MTALPALLVHGVSHHSAGLRVREAAALDDDGCRSLLRQLLASEAVDEAVVLSTCNRTEIYAATATASRARAHEIVRAALLDRTGLGATELACHGFSSWDERAVEHLFRVTAGLESAVLGETEIRAQVRAAVDRSRQESGLGPALGAAFDYASVASARARRSTGIGRGAVSISSVVAGLIASRCRSPRPRIAVVGAGQLAARLVRALAGRQAGELVLVARSAAAGATLAARHDAASAPLEHLRDVLAGADVAILASKAPHALLTVETVGERSTPLLVIDLAVPRNADPLVGGLPCVDLHDLDAVHALAGGASAARDREARAAAELLHREVARFTARRNRAHALPAVEAIWRDAERLRREEIARLGPLDAQERARLDAFSRALVRRLLDRPTRDVLESAEAGGPSRARPASA